MSIKKYILQTNDWISKTLLRAEHEFESFAAALEYAEKCISHSVKIYFNGELVHTRCNTSYNTYA